MGGKAFEGITRRIRLEEIEPTLNWLTSNWSGSKIQGGNYMEHLLGSAGKNPDSGDLDLNLNIELYNQEEVAKALIELLGEDHVKPRLGNNQIFTAVPIKGDPALGYVQVDFMFGDYEWQKFSYYSAKIDQNVQYSRCYWRQQADTSALKGLYRTEFIKALVAFNSDWVLEENGEMIARVGPTFFHDKGCVWRYRYRPMRKDGKARVKELKEVTEEEFLKEFPSAVKARASVVKDPKVVTEMIMGEHHHPEGLNTFEQIAVTTRYNYNAADWKKICDIYLERLNSLKADIPTDIFKSYGIKVK
jgi:hypothetical protein